MNAPFFCILLFVMEVYVDVLIVVTEVKVVRIVLIEAVLLAMVIIISGLKIVVLFTIILFFFTVLGGTDRQAKSFDARFTGVVKKGNSQGAVQLLG